MVPVAVTVGLFAALLSACVGEGKDPGPSVSADPSGRGASTEPNPDPSTDPSADPTSSAAPSPSFVPLGDAGVPASIRLAEIPPYFEDTTACVRYAHEHRPSFWIWNATCDPETLDSHQVHQGKVEVRVPEILAALEDPAAAPAGATAGTTSQGAAFVVWEDIARAYTNETNEWETVVAFAAIPHGIGGVGNGGGNGVENGDGGESTPWYLQFQAPSESVSVADMVEAVEQLEFLP